MTVTFRPAVRQNTPVVAGIAGPTKSGKTLSGLRLATGLAQGGLVAMINTEGAKGHQYADRFSYIATDLTAPFRPEAYTDALKAALEHKPKVVMIDSCSHMHDGPGGVLEWQAEELDRLAGGTTGRARDRYNWTAWIRPKAAENQFIYALLEADCHLVLCFRAKEKIKIVSGRDPIPLGWQPIAGERVAFETGFTLVLPPHSKGVPDMSISELREPYDRIIPGDKQLSEETGAALAKWAAGSSTTEDHSEEIKRLTEELLACAEALGNAETVLGAITKNREANGSTSKHVRWLDQQLSRFTNTLAEREAAA